MEISPISVAENCHIWKAHGKTVAIGRNHKNGKATLKLAAGGEISVYPPQGGGSKKGDPRAAFKLCDL